MIIRPPHRHEWRACRMLLPHCFGSVQPEAFLALDESGDIAGAAAFHHAAQETVGAGVTVVEPCRRRGIGSALLRRVVERAVERGDLRIRLDIDLAAQPSAEPFLHACGFRCQRVVREMEGDLGLVRQPLLEMRARLGQLGKLPADVRIADAAEFTTDDLERIYIDLLVPYLGSPREHARAVVSSPDFDAVVLIAAGGKPVGILVCICNDGRGTGTLGAMAVAPGYRGRGWANLLLLTRAMERGWEAGARRMRLNVDETNLKSLHQSRRLDSVVLRRMGYFVRQLASG